MTKKEIKRYESAAEFGTISDDANPICVFQTMTTEMLKKFASGEIDAKELAAYIISQR
jgi:hypothetical protein